MVARLLIAAVLGFLLGGLAFAVADQPYGPLLDPAKVSALWEGV